MMVKDILTVLEKSGIPYHWCKACDGWYGDLAEIELTGFSSLADFEKRGKEPAGEPGTLSWSRGTLDWSKVQCAAVITSKGVVDSPGHPVLIEVDDPMEAFAVVLMWYDRGDDLVHSIYRKTDPRSLVVIHSDVYIGRDCSIGDRTEIFPNVTLYRNVKIGEDCLIHSGAVVGAPGASRIMINGRWTRWPHLGGVQIGNRVEIYPHVGIARGVVSDTVIGDDVIINQNTTIAHHVKIGARTAIHPQVIIAGSAEIGKDCWIAPGAVVRNGITIGDRVTVGMGAVVTKDVQSGETVIGVPARPIIRREQINDQSET